MVSVVEMGLAIADEALFVNNAPGFVELLSWMAIGARSSENPEHRIFASGLDCAVGIKNPTHGCLKTGVNSVVVAQQEHTAAFEGHAIKTFGNPYAHIVLRGSQKGPNYHSLHEVEKLLFKEKVQYPALLVDASHDNSLLNGKKDAAQQPTVIFQTLDFVKHQPGLQKLLKGFMVESFLQDGHQNLQECLLQGRAPLDGLSVTDPCLGFDKTKKLIFKLAKRLKKI
jgi:3-deoxy-7-phosphoheptulonate synthase